MKLHLRLLAAAATVAAALAAASPAHPLVMVVKSETLGVFAAFSHLDPSGCVQTAVFLGAHTPSNLGVVFVQGDLCTGQPFINGDGFSSDFTLTVSGDLQSAHLTVPRVSIANEVTGTFFDISLDVAFTGAGRIISNEGSVEHTFTLPGMIVHERFRQKVRDATATGVVTDGTTNFAANGSVFAGIRDVDEGTIEVSNQP